MKISEINKKLTELVNSYIANGYTINPLTMGGSQGEICKVDLIKEEDFIRISMDRTRCLNYHDEDAWHGHTILIKVGHSKYSSKETVWSNELDYVNVIAYYEISRNDWYVGSYKEALDIQKKKSLRFHRDRYLLYHTDEIKSLKAISIACKYLKTQVGYKRIIHDKVNVFKTIDLKGVVKYTISYYGNSYPLS